MKNHHPLDDDLKAAFRSVRDAYDGTNPESNTTLQRALVRTRIRERRRSFTRWVVLPFAAVFAVSTAWAGVTGKLELAFVSVLESFHAERTRAEEPSPSSAPTTAAAVAPTATEEPAIEATSVAPSIDAPPEIARSSSEESPVVTASAPAPARSAPNDPPVVTASDRSSSGEPSVVVGTAKAPARAASDRAPLPAPRLVEGPTLVASAAPPVPAVSVSEPDPGAAIFAEGHRLHFIERDPARALAAWDRYLATAPDGRLVPEARYNRALALVRLGRVDEAKTELAVFAGGAYGSYRRDEAKALLDALSRDATARP